MERKRDRGLAMLMFDEGKEYIRQYIEENQSRIIHLEKQGMNPETISQIDAIYRDSVDMAKQCMVSLYVVFDYVMFLHSCSRFDEEKELLLWMKKWYQLTSESKETLDLLDKALSNLDQLRAQEVGNRKADLLK